MKFVVKRPQPVVTDVVHECVVGKAVLHITPQEDGRIWQHFLVSEGCFSEDTMDECAGAWPLQVVLMLRRAADQLETRIREDQEHETSLEGRSVSSGVAQA